MSSDNKKLICESFPRSISKKILSPQITASKTSKIIEANQLTNK